MRPKAPGAHRDPKGPKIRQKTGAGLYNFILPKVCPVLRPLRIALPFAAMCRVADVILARGDLHQGLRPQQGTGGNDVIVTLQDFSMEAGVRQYKTLPRNDLRSCLRG